MNCMYSTECISFACWNHLHWMICERWSEYPAQTPALTAWQYSLLPHLHKQWMYFPMLSKLFYLKVWKIIYSNQCGNLLFLVLTLVIIFFSYCNFPWLCNLGGGNCTDESLFPDLFSVMVYQNNCQHNVRLELQWAYTFLCFVTIYWCVTDIRTRKEVCGCIHLL
jgi:hypothetical protein